MFELTKKVALGFESANKIESANEIKSCFDESSQNPNCFSVCLSKPKLHVLQGYSSKQRWTYYLFEKLNTLSKVLLVLVHSEK